jgi:hypothetical protein
MFPTLKPLSKQFLAMAAVEEEEEAVEAFPTIFRINRVKTVVVDEEMTTVVEAIAEVGMNVVVVVVVVVVGDWSNNGVQMI